MIVTTATIQINSNGTLEDVARKLQEALSLPPFWFDSDQAPPHSITAMAECLGFELWLRNDGLEFQLTVEASMDIHDREQAELADISDWLCKHILIVSDLECRPKQLER